MRIWKGIKLLISFVLILTLVFQFPLSTLATGLESGSITLQPDGTIDTSLIQTETQDAEVVAEIESKRTEYSKEYLLSNGLHMATVYADPIHYATDDGWQDIDNTLKMESVGAGRIYTNTAGVWNVQLPQQLTQNNAVSLTKDGYTLSFAPAGELRTSGELQMQTMRLDDQEEPLSTTALTASTAQIMPIERTASDEFTLDKIQSRLQYANVFSNTNIVYDLQGNRLKESIVMDSYSSTLRGYRYTLNTGRMIPILAESGRIDLYDETGETVIMYMPAPFLMDDAMEHSFDVQVTLTQSGDQYILTYLLPQEWLASEERAWPVILDPIVQASTTWANIEDQTVSSKKYLQPDWGMLQAGYYSSEGITRIFLMYNQLPALSSADVVVRADIKLYLLQNFNDSHQVEVHKVNAGWKENEITWSNMPSFDETIEDFQMVQNAGYYHWNITDIVQEWYQGENTGMMFKMSDAVEAAQVNEWRQFLSSEYGDVRPSLRIVFRNNNGLESYWDYTAASAGRAGTAYVNNYTGNLVLTRGDIGFGGNRMPVSISHIYNANDRADRDTTTNNADQYAGNAFGMGYGWRTNYNQLVYQWSTDTGYYVWEDSDGTDHYFYRESSGIYKDEDGLELTLTTTGSGNQKYKLYDQQGNASYFDTTGRLTKIENNQKVKSSIHITYTASDSKKISTVTDGAGRVYHFIYNDSGLLTRIRYTGTGAEEISYVSYGYNASAQLTGITDKDGKTVVYTYDADHRLTKAQNIDGYSLSFQYTTVADGQPSRVSQMAEMDGAVAGGSLSFAYGNNQTTLTDHNGITNIYQFNNFGNTVSIQDSEGRAQHAQYALGDATDDDNDRKKTNQLSLASKLQNTVGNLLKDASFENSTLWTATGATQSIANDTAYLGSKSLKLAGTGSVQGASVSIAPNGSYTFSAYVKSTADASAKLTFTGASGTIESSEEITGAAEWTRLEVSYTNKGNTAVTVTPGLVTTGTVYMDCAQLEKAVTASRYNLIENGDFRHGTYGWTYTALSGTDGVITADLAAPAVELDSSILQITGGPTTAKGAYQTLPISGSEGDTFVLAGWAKGNAAPLVEGGGRAFGLKAELTYTDGSKKEVTASFNPDSEDWQYAALPIAAEKDYSSIKITVAYEKNVNTVWFDGIQLFKETFGQSYKYDDDGNITGIVDLQKQETAYEYDANSNLTKIIQNDKAKMRYEYDEYHNVIKAITQRQDEDGNAVDGMIYTFAYDDYGNNKMVSISDGTYTILSTAEYSADHNRLIKTVDALGNVTQYDYDANTNLLNWVQYPEDSEATRTIYDYDEMFRTAKAVCTTDTGLKLSAEYTYSADDLLSGIETPSTTYDFAYGAFSQMIVVSIGGRDLASYHYTNDANRYLHCLEYGNGDYINYTYDSLGRVIQEIFEDGDTVIYRYDNNGALAQVEDSSSGITTRYYYDFTGRMMKYTETGTDYYHSVGYEYDTKNNLTQTVEIINGTKRTSSYTYDEDNRLTVATNDAVSTHYYYDDFGRVEKQETKQNGTLILTEHYTFTATTSGTSAQVATYRTVSNGYDITYTYTYDDNGNILTVNDGTYTTSYVYDSQNQLTDVTTSNNSYTATYSYDNSGNIQYKIANGVTVSYDYDDNEWGDLLTAYDDQIIAYDGIGNPTEYIQNTLQWGGRQLEHYQTGGTACASYQYNADGIRIQKIVNNTQETNYFVNGSTIVGEQTGDNIIWYIYDGFGEIIGFTYNDTPYYYIKNIQGDVCKIVDANGNVVGSYTYDAWGRMLTTSGAMASVNHIRYRSYYYDTESGYYYLQSRYYDPNTGRFLNADGFVTTGQGFTGNNMFAYCGNNPVMYVDHRGFYYACYEDRITTDGCGGVAVVPDYIYSQNKAGVGERRLGITTVSHGGCGVIATYNALFTLGEAVTLSEVLNYYNGSPDRTVFGGLLGISPLQVVEYFERKGYRVIMTADYDGIEIFSKKADACILWYAYPETYCGIEAFGAHFFHYRKCDAGYRGYNTGKPTSIFNHPYDYGVAGGCFSLIGIYIYK